MSLRIRNSLERSDWAFIREVCCLTGNAGEPIDQSRWPFFSEQWVGPYERLRPEWGFVAEDSGRRMGYLTGCPDSRRFLFEKRWLFDFPLYVQTLAGGFPTNGDLTRFQTRFLKKDRGPEDRFSISSTEQVLTEYPAHLHMNLDAAARGRGVGRKLVDRYREELRAIGVHGIHLYCGPKPLPFYEKVGFQEIDRIEFRPGVWVYRLGSRF